MVLAAYPLSAGLSKAMAAMAIVAGQPSKGGAGGARAHLVSVSCPSPASETPTLEDSASIC